MRNRSRAPLGATVLALALALAPAAAQADGALVLDENFSDNSRNWLLASDQNGAMYFENGRMVIESRTVEKSKYTSTHRPLDMDQDFRIEVSFHKVSGKDDYGFGIVFGARNNGDQLRFMIAGDGHYAFQISEGGNVQSPIPWTVTPYVNKGNATNVLAVQKRGARLHFYVNGEEVDGTKMPDVLGPLVGAMNNNNGKVEISRYRVWIGNTPEITKPVAEVIKPQVETQKPVVPVVEKAKPQAAAGAPKILAVFNFEDASKKMKPDTLTQLSDYLAVLLTKKGYSVVPREQLRKQLADAKKESYKACYDTACQIELGKAMAAEGTVSTRVLKIADTCVITSNLFDLKTETTVKAASVETGCADGALLKAMHSLSDQL